MAYRIIRVSASNFVVTSATLAQLVERLIRNQQVAGSIPAGGSIPFNNFRANGGWLRAN